MSENNARNIDETFLEIARRVQLKLEQAVPADTNAKEEIELRAGNTGLEEENKCCCYLM